MERAHLNKNIILLSLVIQILLFKNVIAQTVSPGPYYVQSGSVLFIKGSSNINSFVFKASEVYGTGNLEADSPSPVNSLNDNKYTTARVCVSILVKSLDSGNEKRNNDMYEAINAEEFPFIHYELISGEVVKHPDINLDWFYVQTKGELSIAGKTNTIEMNIQMRQLPDGRFNVKGSKSILMTDYGIKPPTAFLGLIKADDRLEVHFNIIAAPEVSVSSLEKLLFYCKKKNF